MMAFAPPHQEHSSILAGPSYVHGKPKSFQMEQDSHSKRQLNHTFEGQNVGQMNYGTFARGKFQESEAKDDLHHFSSRPDVSSPPPRPIRSNVRPAAEGREAKTKTENQFNSFDIPEEQIEESSDDEKENQEEGEKRQIQDVVEEKSNQVYADRPFWGERSMSLDEATSMDQQRSIVSQRTNRSRLDSAPSGTQTHYRSRSHFSIPDIAIISADEEGNEVRYELQLEQAKRRLIFGPSKDVNYADDEDHGKSKHANQEQNDRNSIDQKQQTKAPATMKAKAQLAMFTFPTSHATDTSTNKKKQGKSSYTNRAPPSIYIMNTENQSHISDAIEAAKYPLPVSPTSPSFQKNMMQVQQEQMRTSSNGAKYANDSSRNMKSSHDTELKESQNNSSTSKFGKRLRKSSLPNLFGKKERDAANAIAMQSMPNGEPSSAFGHPSNSRQQQQTTSSDPVNVTESLSKVMIVNKNVSDSKFETERRDDGFREPKTKRMEAESESNSQYVGVIPPLHHQNLPFTTHHHASNTVIMKPDGPTSPTSQVPSSPTSTLGRPSSTSSLTKKEIKQRQKEERNLIKELERVDKMVRKHDEKAIKAQKKAEEKKRKEEKKQKKDNLHLQISAPIAVTVMPASQSIHSSNTIQAGQMTDQSSRSAVPNSIITPSPLGEAFITPFPTATQVDQNGPESFSIDSEKKHPGKRTVEKQSLDDESTEPSYEAEYVHTSDDQDYDELTQPSKSAPRISLPPSSAASLSLFDSLYKEVDAMESSFDMQYPVEAQERRKSIATPSAPQSPNFI